MATVCKSHFLSNGPAMAQSWGIVTFSHCWPSWENNQPFVSVISRCVCATAAIAKAAVASVSIFFFIVSLFNILS